MALKVQKQKITPGSVLVTGGNTGIGRQLALDIAAAGYPVIIHYLAKERSSDKTLQHSVLGKGAAQETAKMIQNNGGRAEIVAADLRSEEEIESLAKYSVEAFDGLFAIINNAAQSRLPDSVEDIELAPANEMFMVNVVAPLMLLNRVRVLAQTHPTKLRRVLNISTNSAQVFPTQITYGASKAAVEAWTRSAAYELGPHGITVNAIAPGPIQTGWLTDELEQLITSQIPMRRCGFPEDIGAGVLFFLSENANWVTGQVLRICGGATLSGLH